MKNNQLMTGGAVLAVLIIGYFLFSGAPSGSPEGATKDSSQTTEGTVKTPTTPKASGTTSGTSALPKTTTDGIYLVNYTSRGFVPQSLQIPVGKSVRFVNNSGKAMRIGSTDTTNSPIYNAFNQSKTVGQGGTYEYTFTDRGNYTYNNRNNVGDYGVINVK